MRDGMGWDVLYDMGWDGIERDVMQCDGIGCIRTGWDAR